MDNFLGSIYSAPFYPSPCDTEYYIFCLNLTLPFSAALETHFLAQISELLSQLPLLELWEYLVDQSKPKILRLVLPISIFRIIE